MPKIKHAPSPALSSEEEPLDCLPPDTQPEYTPEEAARDWEILRQYEAEIGPISAPIRPLLDPENIVSIIGTPVPRSARKTREAS